MTSDNFELLPDSQQPTETKCFRHLRDVFTTHPCLYGFMFITIFVLDLAEVCNDWLFLQDIMHLRKGLVYGPLNPTLVTILLVASATGTLVVVLEIFNITREMCSGQPWVDLDLVSAIVVWFEEIPTISTIFAMSMCHNEPISHLQLTKAFILILSVVFRIAVPLTRTFLMSKQAGGIKMNFRKSVYKVVTTVGLCLALCSAITIFISSHVIASEDNKLQVRLPQEIWDGQFVQDQYFADVGVYFHLTGIKETTGEEYWLKLADINEFVDTDVINVKITYVKQDNVIEKFVVHSYNVTDERYRECYKHETSDDKKSKYTFATCKQDFIANNENQEKLIFKFVFLHPQMYLILGDITYNVKYIKNNICYDLLGNNTNIYDTTFGDTTKILFGRLLYLKLETTILSRHRLVEKNLSGNATRDNLKYDIDHVMLEADKIWQTGIYGCDCTGNYGPTIDGNITLSC